MVHIKLNYFRGRPNKAKEMFWNIFDWPLCWLLKNSSISVTRPVLGGSVHTGCYIHNSLVHVANICIIYLHLIDAFLKVIIAMLYFFHLKNSSNIMKIHFNSISIYSWKKISSSTNEGNKCVARFFISNTFTSNASLRLAKNNQKLSNTLRLNFCYLKIDHIFHSSYHPKTIGCTLKTKQQK